MKPKAKPSDQVWIVHIGYTRLVLPDHAAAKALITALTKAKVVSFDHESDHFVRAESHDDRISFETVDADRVHLDRERPRAGSPEKSFLQVNGYPRLNAARQRLLGGET